MRVLLTMERGGTKRRPVLLTVHQLGPRRFRLTTTAQPSGLVADVWPVKLRACVTDLDVATNEAAKILHAATIDARYERYELLATLEYGLESLTRLIGFRAVNRALSAEAMRTGVSLKTPTLTMPELVGWVRWLAVTLATALTMYQPKGEDEPCPASPSPTPKDDRPSSPVSSTEASCR